MNSEKQKVLETIATELKLLAQSVLESNGMKGSDLQKEIDIVIKSTDKPVVIEAYFANYINFLEHGRAPKQGKQPPIDALRDWALARNIPTDNSTLFLISRAIWRDGLEARPLLAYLAEEVDRAWETEWSDMLFDAICEELAACFEQMTEMN